VGVAWQVQLLEKRDAVSVAMESTLQATQAQPRERRVEVWVEGDMDSVVQDELREKRDAGFVADEQLQATPLQVRLEPIPQATQGQI
jgi:hypothetical protein